MDEHCSFCKIVAGHAPAVTVYQNEHVVAFMDTRPIRAGHLLVIPRVHEADLFNLALPLYSEVLIAARILAQGLQRAFVPKRVGLVVAGFDVPHAHVHLIPMVEYHDITSRALLDGMLVPATLDELQANALRLQESLALSPAASGEPPCKIDLL
jgi:histidine triad (HIT) family protein